MENIPFYLEPWLSNQKCLRFFFRKISKKPDKYSIISNHLILAKKLIITKGCDSLFILKYILIDFLNFGKILKFEVTVSNQKFMNAH